MRKKSAMAIIKQTFSEFGDDKALRLSAAMAYYSVFSIGPLLVLIIGVAGLAFGQESVRAQVQEQLHGLLGDKGAGMVESMMTSREGQKASLIATIIGGLGLLLGASGVFGQLQDALNTIWEVQPKPGRGVLGFIKDRFLSLTMVLGIGFLLLVSMVLSTLVQAFSTYLSALILVPGWAVKVFHAGVAFGVVSLLFALIFKVLPDVKIQWRDVWVGALCTSLLFVAGKLALGWYLGRESTTSAFGAGSAFVVVLMYVYYSSLILFLGAEFTQVYARSRGAQFEPLASAEKLTDVARARQGLAPKSSPAPTRQPAPAYAKDHHPEPAKRKSIRAPRPVTDLVGRVQKHWTPSLRGNDPFVWLGTAAVTGLAAGLLLKPRLARKALNLFPPLKNIV